MTDAGIAPVEIEADVGCTGVRALPSGLLLRKAFRVGNLLICSMVVRCIGTGVIFAGRGVSE